MIRDFLFALIFVYKAREGCSCFNTFLRPSSLPKTLTDDAINAKLKYTKNLKLKEKQERIIFRFVCQKENISAWNCARDESEEKERSASADVKNCKISPDSFFVPFVQSLLLRRLLSRESYCVSSRQYTLHVGVNHIQPSKAIEENESREKQRRKTRKNSCWKLMEVTARVVVLRSGDSRLLILPISEIIRGAILNS